MRKVASLQEIDSHWDLKDVLDAHEALDIMDEIESYANAQAAKGK